MDEDLPSSQFRDDGVVILRGAFSAEAVVLREMLWRHIESTTPVRFHDPATWAFDGHVGLRAIEERSIWHPVHGSKPVVDALAAIFGAGGWTPPGPPHLLVSFPVSRPWSMPAGQWHVDFGHDRPTWPVDAVKMFALLDTVEPGGGGTLLLQGGHRLVERAGLGDRELFDSDPYLKRLNAGGAGRDVLGETVEVHGVPICPVEVTGEAGDVVLTHMQVFHSPAPNVSSRPRQMLGNTVAAGRQ